MSLKPRHGERIVPRSWSRNPSGMSATAPYHSRAPRFVWKCLGITHGTPAIKARTSEPTKDKARPATISNFQ